MSDEVAPETPDAAVRSFIGAVAFTVILSGGEMVVAGRPFGWLVGLLGLPLYCSLLFWRALKGKLNARFRHTLNGMATDARWWLGLVGVFVAILMLSPFVEQRRLPFTAPRLLMSMSVAPETRIDHPSGISLREALAHDFPGTQQVSADINVQPDGDAPAIPVRVIAFRDRHEGAEFLGAYISRSAYTEQLVKQVVKGHRDLLDKLKDGEISSRAYGQTGRETTAVTQFTGMIVIYYEDELSLNKLAALESYSNSQHINLILRSREYLLTHMSPPPLSVSPK